jgi:hypothetical protein
MGKMDLRADTSKNRLYVVLDGYFSDQQVKEACGKVIREVKKLKPGFTAINDISGFRPATPQGAAEMQRTQGVIMQAGLARVVRITGSALGEMQFRRTSRNAGYAGDTAASIQQAEALLDRGK